LRHDRALAVMQGGEPQQRYAIGDATMVGEARRAAQYLAQGAQLDATSVGRVGIVVTELASNLVRHAGSGEIFLQVVRSIEGSPQLEILSLDSGPGMADIERCLSDGFSTAGTPGTGLGAVRRLSVLFDLFSTGGKGCVVVSRIGLGRPGLFGAVCTPVRGETACGDCWRLAQKEGESSAIVLDGLGHGVSAATASQAGAQAFAEAPFDGPGVVIERVHQRLAGTRGAAGACLQRTLDGRLRFAGIGNIGARAFGADSSQGLTSHNGILGVQIRRLQQFDYDGRLQPLLIMHSDGVSARWELDQYPGLRMRHPAVIAGVLYREHRRERDDATILVVGHE